MSMFGIVFPDPMRQERMGMLLAAVAFGIEGEGAASEYVQPIMDLRLRDCWIERQPDGPPCLAIYTRNGGGNREHVHEDGREHCIACAGEKATEHPAYLWDRDDEFDSTYRTYRFAFPDTLPGYFKDALNENAEEPRDMSEQWQIAIQAIGGEASRRG